MTTDPQHSPAPDYPVEGAPRTSFPHPPYAPPRASNGHATASLVLGAIAGVLGLVPALNLISYLLALPAIAFGLVGLVHASRSGAGKLAAGIGVLLAVASMVAATLINVWAYHQIRDAAHGVLDRVGEVQDAAANAAAVEVAQTGLTAATGYADDGRVPTVKELRRHGYTPNPEVHALRIVKTDGGFCVQARDSSEQLYHWTYTPTVDLTETASSVLGDPGSCR